MNNGIGLKKNTVRVVRHQKIWRRNFENEKELIASIGNRHVKRIEHVGSTSVQGMPAKPIIDIIVGIDKFSHASKLVKGLSRVGYEFRLVPRRFQWLFVKMDGDKDTHYLKVIRYRGVYWNEYMNFKKILLSNGKSFEKYKKLKLDLGKKHPNNRKKYTKGKQDLIRKLLFLT
jgi:GrpB-like predicted nucleotidyltransferase (UPF0157 family)